MKSAKLTVVYFEETAQMTPRQLEFCKPDPAGLARKLAREPMRPAKPQSACDVGLFSDERDQADLVDRARK